MGLFSRRSNRPDGRELGPPAYSNDSVIARIEREHGVDRETARAWFGEMLVFLDLCAASDEVLSPPPDVDKAWHAFLLHSGDYEAYCRERFGRTIHHQPTGAPDPHAYRRAYARRNEYGSGTPDPLMWAIPAGFVAGSAGDGEEEEQARQSAGAGGASGTGVSGSADDSNPGDGGSGDGGSGGGFFSNLFGGGDSGSGGSGGDSGGSGGGDSGGGSSCGGGGCGGGGGGS